VHHGIGAAAAVDRLSRAAKQDAVIGHLPHESGSKPLAGLRGLLVPGTIDGDGMLAGPTAFDDQPASPRNGNRPMPYVRFGEGEQVYGFSFKIQPPPQAPDPASRGS